MALVRIVAVLLFIVGTFVAPMLALRAGVEVTSAPGWLLPPQAQAQGGEASDEAPHDDDDDEDDWRRGNPASETDNPHRNRTRTNKLGKDAFKIEGQVLRTHCSRTPPEIVIGTLDGEVTIRVMKNKQDSRNFKCEWAHKDDYLFVEFAEKQHEFLYDGYEFDIDEEDDDGDHGHGNHGHTQQGHGGRQDQDGHEHEEYEVTIQLPAGLPMRLSGPEDQVVLEVAPGTFASPLTFTLRSAGHPASEPPGEHVGELTFEVIARDGSSTLRQLPSSVTVIVNYHHEDVSGLDERRFALAVWDPATSQWLPLPSTALPNENRVTTTTNRTGIYALYQRR